MGDQSSTSRVLRFAEAYARNGWTVLPIPSGQKAPRIDEWQRLRLSPAQLVEAFRGAPGARPLNVGINLGEPSAGLCDVDLDCPEAVALADEMLPATLTFGRPSRPASHRLYIALGGMTEQFRDPLGHAMLLELRATPRSARGTGVGGSQTVFPPSIHPSGELVSFTAGWKGLPLTVDAKVLARQVRQLAVASLIARRAGLDAARACARGGPMPEVDPMTRGRLAEWLGVRVAAGQKPRAQVASMGPTWVDRLRNTDPALVALALGIDAQPGRSIARCPVCGMDRRSRSDRRPAVGLVTARDGTLLWCHGLCHSHGNSVQFASLVVLGKPRPDGRAEWLQLRTSLISKGLD